MSLYDDATFIFSGEAAAGAPHKAYSLKPVEKLKATVLNANSDLSTSGPLSASTNSLGLVLGSESIDATASIANGVVTITTGSNGSAKGRVYTSNGTTTAYLENGKAYNLTYTVVENNGVTTFQYSEDGIIRSAPSTVGTHAVSFKRGQTNDSPYFYLQTQTPSANIVLKDIIVREAEQRSLDFRVSRDANLGATRVKADGLIEKGRENLIKYSNTLDGTGWANTTGSPVNYNAAVGGQSGYDGSTNAWLIEKTTVTNSYVGGPFFGYDGVFTWSMYAKNEGTKDNALHMYTPYSNAYFNLVNGTIISQGGSNRVEVKMVPVTGSSGDTDRWYRCSVTGVGEIVDNDDDDRPRFKIINTDGSDGGDGAYSSTGKIFVQNFQFEAGLVATAPIESKGMPATAGLQANEPRYDYLTSTNDCPGALVEPTRINYFTNSEYAAGNTNVTATVTQNYAVSPEGLQNAFRIQHPSGTSFLRVNTSNVDITSLGDTFTFSVFVKKASSSVSTFGGFGINFFGTSAKVAYVIFDEYNGTAAKVDSVGNMVVHPVENHGDYWRFSASYTDTGSNTAVEGILYAMISTNGSSVTVAAGGSKDYTAYGLQFEEGPWCTSYMPTYGSSVTRERDHFISPVDYDEYATEDFTVFIDYKDFKSNGTLSAGLWRAIYGNATSRSVFQYNKSIGYEGFPSATPSTPGSEYSANHATEGANKIAVVYNRDSVAVYVDGVQTKLDYSVDTTKKGISHMQLLYGESKMTVNRCMIFNRPLTNDEAIALTT